MRVLQIINSLEIGGAEKLILDLVPQLQCEGLVVDVLLLNGVETPFLKQLKETFHGNIFVLGSSNYNPLCTFKIMGYLKKYDLVHVHLFPSQYFVAAAKMLSFSKVPLIITEHNTENKRIHNKWFKYLEKFIYSLYSKVICITEDVKDSLIKHYRLGPNKLVVINNGIDIRQIEKEKSYSKQQFGYEDDDILLIMVAGFRTQKDQDSVIKVIAELPENFKLILVGDGERRIALEKLIKDLKVGTRVNMMGIRNDVPSLIKMCDVAVLSSHWEGFGLAAAEAMACGVPVVASNVPGLANVVGNGGLLFQRGDVIDLKEKICSLLNLEISDEIIRRGLIKARNYDLEKMCKSTIELYKKVVFKN